MSRDISSMIRELAPKGYHFDAYNELNSPNNRDRPFFEEGVIPIGKYYLTKRLENNDTLLLQYSSICPNGRISFKPYRLTLKMYIEMLRNALKEKSDFITFTIPIEYHATEYGCRYCDDKNKDCSHLLKDVPESTVAAVSFDPQDIKDALSVYFGITTNNHSSKGGKNMKTTNFKSLFGMNLEIGVSKDPNIAATFMGVAIRNPQTGNYHVYDPATKTLKNYAKMKFGDFRVFLLPDPKLIIDQPYKLDGKYYYVRAVEGNTATLVDAVEGTIVQKILSECVIPGMNFYTRVVALDPRTMFDPSSQTDMSKNVLAAICMSQWSKGESDFSLDGIGEDSMNGLGMLMLMGGSNGLSNMLNGEGGMSLPMLLMMGMGNESEEVNGYMQALLLSQIMNGGNTNAGGNLLESLVPGIAPAQPEVSAGNDTVVCPNCDEEYPAGTNYCANCGAHTVVKGKHCVHCGAKLMDGAAFCHNCGQKVVRDTCPSCNSKLPEGAKFCSVCGCNVSTGKAPASATPKTKKASTAKKPTGKTGTTRAKGATAEKSAVKPAPKAETTEE